MLKHHIVTFYSDRIGVRSSEKPLTVVLGKGMYLVEGAADLGVLLPAQLVALHNHLHDEGHVRKLGPDTAQRTWERLATTRLDPAPEQWAPPITKEIEHEPDTGSSVLPERSGRRARVESAPERESPAHRVEQPGRSPSRIGSRTPKAPGQGTIADRVAALLQRPEGASKAEIVEALGANENTVRGTLSVLSRTMPVTKEKNSVRGTIYRLTSTKQG